MTRSSPGYPLIDVAIVTARGSWPLLHDCVLSLKANPPDAGALAIHVVDNASRDGTVEALRAGHPEVEVEELARNLGFAAGCNRVIRHATAPYVLLLNPDTVVNPGALDRLVDSLERHPRAAVAGPRLLGPDGVPDHNAKRSFPTAAAARAHLFRAGRGRAAGYGREDIPDDGAGIVDSVSGSCMLVRRDAIDEVGLLDEDYWMYGEDLDWCRRFGQHSWEIRYEGSATIMHVKHGVTGRHRSLRTNWAFHRSMGRFYRRFEAGPRPMLDFAVYTGVLVRFVVSALRSAVARRLAD